MKNVLANDRKVSLASLLILGLQACFSQNKLEYGMHGWSLACQCHTPWTNIFHPISVWCLVMDISILGQHLELKPANSETNYLLLRQPDTNEGQMEK